MSWSHGGGRLRCQSHSCAGFSERRPEEEGFGEEGENARGQPSGRVPLQPIVLVAQALAGLQSSLRARVHLCRDKMALLCEESEWDGALLQQGGLGMALLSTSIIARDRISPVLITLRANPTFMSGLVAWAIAQVLFLKLLLCIHDIATDKYVHNLACGFMVLVLSFNE